MSKDELIMPSLEPRVWLPGDTVPAGVAVIDEPGAGDGGYWVATDMPARYDRPVIEIRVPDVAAVIAAVAAEEARRALSAAVPPAEAGSDNGAGEARTAGSVDAGASHGPAEGEGSER
jgi:hypothetical protein